MKCHCDVFYLTAVVKKMSGNGDLSSGIIFGTVSFGAYLMFMSTLCISMWQSHSFAEAA